MALADGPCAVNDGARRHARATAQSSTRNRPLCATRAREGLAVPAILPLFAADFSPTPFRLSFASHNRSLP